MRFIYSALFTLGLLVTVPAVLLEDERIALAQTETVDEREAEAERFLQQGVQQFQAILQTVII